MTDDAPTERARRWLLGLAHEHRLSPTQRRIVSYMIDSMPTVAVASTVEVAEAAGASQPTVTRLATALGYATYAEFRGAVRAVVFSPAAPAPALPAGASSAVRSEQQNLGALERTVAGEPMRRAVDALAGTRPLGILGVRASSALAAYLGYFAQRVLPDVRVLTDAAAMPDAVLGLRADGADALLAFVMPRYPAATVRALEQARSLGITTVAIADKAMAPFAGHVDELLVAPVGTDLVFDSHAAAVVLAITLLDSVAEREPRRTQERLEAHEQLVDRWVHPET